MKLFLATTALLGLSEAERILGRSARGQLKQLIQHSVVEDAEKNGLDPAIQHGLESFVNSPGFEIPVKVSDRWGRWYDQQTGREDCATTGSCETGAFDVTALQGYGCWCFFGNIDSTLGRGPPLDAFDSVCQKLALCMRCVIVDAENADEDCDPFTQTFNATFSLQAFAGGVGAMTTSCQTDNVENCSWQTCSCTMTMFVSYFNLSFDSSNVYDDNMRHINGFDYNVECPQQGKADDRQCCGVYPGRRTFDNGDANRACCHGKTIYNPIRHQCCDDGQHVGLGSRCD